MLIAALLLITICIPFSSFLQQRLQVEKHYRWSINQAELNQFALRPVDALKYYRMAIADAHKLGDSPKLEADLNYKASTLFWTSSGIDAEMNDKISLLSQAFDLYGRTPYCRGEQLRVGEKLVETIEALRSNVSAETTQAILDRTNKRQLPSVPLIDRLHDDMFTPEKLDQLLKKMGKDPDSYDVRLALAQEYFARKEWLYAVVEYEVYGHQTKRRCASQASSSQNIE